MTQEPQAIFRGSGLIAGGFSDPVTLTVIADEITLDAGLGLCYKLGSQDVVRLEVVEEKRLAIRHTLIDCPSDIIFCTEEPAAVVMAQIRDIGFEPSGNQEDPAAFDRSPVRWERLGPVILVLVVAAIAIDHYYPIMGKSYYGGDYLSLGVIPFFLFTSLLELVPPLQRLFLTSSGNTGSFSFNLRILTILFGLLSFASVVVLLGVPAWLAPFAALILFYLLSGFTNQHDTEDSSGN